MANEKDLDEVYTSMKRMEASRYAFMRQVDHQCETEGQMHRFTRSVDRIEYKIKSKMDSLNVFVSRLEKIQTHVRFGTSDLSATSEVNKELKDATSRRDFLSNDSTVCEFCGLQVLKTLLDVHVTLCLNGQRSMNRRQVFSNGTPTGCHESIDSRVDEPNITSYSNLQLPKTITLPVAVKPQPPRNLHILSVGHDFIQIGWSPPILEGGEILDNYEVNFKRCRVVKKGKRKYRTIIAEQPIPCARWCIKSPVPKNSFIIDNLEALTEYVDIKLRCRNKIGWSDFSEQIESAETSAPQKPLPPQRFKVVNVTSKSIDFVWSAPFQSGGGHLQHYELSFAETVPRDNQVVGSESNKTMLKKKFVRIPATKLDYQLANLRGGARFSCIQIRAVNHHRLFSDPMFCKDVSTLPSSKVDLLKEEIERVQSSSEEYIDSDFFQEGVIQREERMNYLLKLKTELEFMLEKEDVLNSTHAESIIKHSMITEHSTSNQKLCISQEEKEDEEKRKVLPDFSRRKGHFIFRMKVLKEEIEDYKRKCRFLVNRKTFLSRQMVQTQKRVLVLNAEIDRLESFRGKQVTSSVLHGSEQTFSTIDLKKELRQELESSYASIAASKNEIIMGNNSEKEMKKTIDCKEENLKERNAAYISFMQKATNIVKARQRLSQLPHDIMKRSLSVWLSKTKSNNKFRSLVKSIVTKHKQFFVTLALKKWKVVTINGPSLNSLCTMEGWEIEGRGGFLLREVEIARKKNVEAVEIVMKQLFDMKVQQEAENNSSSVSEEDIELPQMEKSALVKGDFYLDQGNIEKAIRYYESVILGLSNLRGPTFPPSYVVILQCKLYERLGRAYMKSKSWNLAMLHLENLLTLAKSQRSDSYTGIAHLHLGECYSQIGECSISKEHFLNAMSKFRSINDKSKQAQVHLGLCLCYDKRNDSSHANLSAEKYKELIYDKENKINDALKTIDSLHSRLINVKANEGIVVELQNASPSFLLAKRGKMKIQDCIERKREELAISTRAIEDLSFLMKQIENELHEANTTKKKVMVSSLVHEDTQKIETGELAIRLQSRLEMTRDELSREVAKEKKLSTEIVNFHDDLLSLEADMKLEQGPLIQKVMKNRTIRCMAFNSSNIANNDVTGSEAGNLNQAALTIDNDLFIYNILSGKMEDAFVGDKIGRHIGEINGHTSVITSVFFAGSRVYTGSMDKSLMCWDVKQRKRIYVCRGHEATVTCIHVDGSRLFSGATDTLIILWESRSGEMLHQIHGHSKGILSIHSCLNWCVSGDSDGSIFIWDEKISISALLGYCSSFSASNV